MKIINKLRSHFNEVMSEQPLSLKLFYAAIFLMVVLSMLFILFAFMNEVVRLFL